MRVWHLRPAPEVISGVLRAFTPHLETTLVLRPSAHMVITQRGANQSINVAASGSTQRRIALDTSMGPHHPRTRDTHKAGWSTRIRPLWPPDARNPDPSSPLYVLMVLLAELPLHMVSTGLPTASSAFAAMSPHHCDEATQPTQ